MLSIIRSDRSDGTSGNFPGLYSVSIAESLLEPSIHLEERRERRGRRIPALATLAVITLLGASLYGLFGFMEANAAFGTVLDLSLIHISEPTRLDLASRLPSSG